MANEIDQNPWRLDTTGTVFTHPVKIQTIHWVLPTASGDDLEITDRRGEVIVTAKAEANLQSQIFRLEAWYDGLILATLDTGTVLVHIA